MKYFYKIAMILLMSTTVLVADEWFAKIGIGMTNISYPDELQTDIEALDSLSYIDRTKSAIDMGVYWSINSNYIAGFNINGHGDYFTDKITNYEMNINAYNYAFSNIYYINKIEDGLFIRGDVGLVRILVGANNSYTVSDTGFGAAIGGGYCYNIDNTLSIQAELLFTDYYADGDNVRSTQLLFSLLF